MLHSHIDGILVLLYRMLRLRMALAGTWGFGTTTHEWGTRTPTRHSYNAHQSVAGRCGMTNTLSVMHSLWDDKHLVGDALLVG